MTLDASLLLGASAHNPHVQQMARALEEGGALYAYLTGGVDSYRGALARRLRRVVERSLPRVDRQLKRRAITEVSSRLVYPRWGWELSRVAATRVDERIADWIWERSEFALDRACARIVRDSNVGFFGIEYGALAALEAAAGIGQPGIVAFLSPHHRTLARWVDSEFEKVAELSTPGRAHFASLIDRRNARLDAEAAAARWIVTGSSFTTRSLVDAGIPAHKIVTVPLGGPEPAISSDALPSTARDAVRVVYVGPVSVRKGAHYLLRAWKKAAGPGMELHFYGKMLLPQRLCEAAQRESGGSVVFHGSIPSADLRQVYLDASVLVLPTLCDGFGQVVSDALAHGLPVITTTNAGAADAIREGVTGFIVPPADEGALAAALAWCAEHPRALLDMRAAALASAERWTWTHFREAFRDRLAAALGSPQGRPAHRSEQEAARA